jgi:hypothetical protein
MLKKLADAAYRQGLAKIISTIENQYIVKNKKAQDHIWEDKLRVTNVKTTLKARGLETSVQDGILQSYDLQLAALGGVSQVCQNFVQLIYATFPEIKKD